MTLAALIFDVDGTLAETEEAHRHAFNLSFAEAGLGWHWDRDTYRRLLRTTGGKERMRRLLNVVASGRVDLGPLVTHQYALDDINDAYDLFANQRDGVLKVAIKP